MKLKRATQNKDSENYIADFHCLSIYNHVRCCMVISNYYLSIIMLTITVFLCYFRRSSYLVTHIPLAYIYRTIIHSLKTLRTLITLIAIALKEQLITFSTVIFSWIVFSSVKNWKLLLHLCGTFCINPHFSCNIRSAAAQLICDAPCASSNTASIWLPIQLHMLHIISNSIKVHLPII